MSKIPILQTDTASPAELNAIFEQLAVVLRTLNPEQNFKVYKWEGTIAVSAEQRIRHPLQRIPVGRLIVRRKGGDVVDGDTAWTSENVYLKNLDASLPAEVTVLFYL